MASNITKHESLLRRLEALCLAYSKAYNDVDSTYLLSMIEVINTKLSDQTWEHEEKKQ